MEKFFDAHTHVQFAAYDADREEVISRAKDGGVRFINIERAYLSRWPGFGYRERRL